IVSAQKKGIDKSKLIIKSVEREDLPHYIYIADISIFFIKPTFSKKGSSPTKQGEIMSMGIPLIINSNVGDSEEILLNSEAGIVIDKFKESTYNSIIDNVEKLINLNKTNITLGANS